MTGDSPVERSCAQDRRIENRAFRKSLRRGALVVLFVAAGLLFCLAQFEARAAESAPSPHASLLSLASRHFENLTQAERSVLEYLDVKNVRRSGD